MKNQSKLAVIQKQITEQLKNTLYKVIMVYVLTGGKACPPPPIGDNSVSV